MYVVLLQLTDQHEFYFLDSKPNHILPGTFTKVAYCHGQYTLNNVFFHLPFIVQSVQCNNILEHEREHEQYMTFDLQEEHNRTILQQCQHVEQELLNSYFEFNQTMKSPVYAIHKQLSTGKCKIHGKPSTTHPDDGNGFTCIIKISGIWESETEYGITYRILTSSPMPFP